MLPALKFKKIGQFYSIPKIFFFAFLIAAIDLNYIQFCWPFLCPPPLPPLAPFLFFISSLFFYKQRTSSVQSMGRSIYTNSPGNVTAALMCMGQQLSRILQRVSVWIDEALGPDKTALERVLVHWLLDTKG